MRYPIVAEELRLLDAVNSLLNDEPTTAAPSEASTVEELARLRELLQGAKTEDQPALMQQWNRQLALLDQLRAARGAPQVNRESPYFAHLRLRENGAERDILLGKATRLQRGVRIVDWRNAPIARIFYRYQQGDQYEEEIAGRVLSGDVAARRTVTIRSRELRRVDAPEGSFRHDETAADGWSHEAHGPPRLAGGQGAAMRAHAPGAASERRLGTDPHGLERRADKHLPDIAGLIDAQQFELIARPSSGFVVIRGTAGSGKTTVALHRIAFLAYADPAIDSAQTLVIVFSRALRDYVSHVLPALGVNSVHVRTFHEWSSEQVRRLFPKLPRKMRESPPGVVHRLKLHPGLLTAMQRQVARAPGPPTAEQVIDDWASTLSQADLLEEVFAKVAPDAFTTDELCRAAAWNRERCREVVAWTEGDLSSNPEMDPEDDPLLLRAWQLRVGAIPVAGGRRLQYRHIAVDEVQDFSPVEIQVLLGCLDERQSITLAGDTQQHVVQDGGFTSWANFFQDLGLAGTEVNTLEISYRCTREVADFAGSVLGDLREDDTPPLTTRSGPAVEFFRFTDHGACVAFLADALKGLIAAEPLASVALLTPSREISATYYAGLLNSEVPRLRRVENQDFTFSPGIELTEVEQVKGLEFDYVVLIEASAAHYPVTPSARRMLHVGATRAIHQLWLTSVGSPSPLLQPHIGS